MKLPFEVMPPRRWVRYLGENRYKERHELYPI